MPPDEMRALILTILVLPLAAGIAVAALGPRRLVAVRWIALAAVVVNLLLTGVLVGDAAAVLRKPGKDLNTFRPEFVPGDPGEDQKQPNGTVKRGDSHTTAWDLLPLGRSRDARPAAIRFYLGLDGLNIWLIALTSLLMVPSVLVSWNSVKERANEFYAWLLVLQTGMLGVFLAFDIVIFYVFFELTLVPLFFLIGIWGGPARREAARKFFLFTFAGSLVTLLGMIGLIVAVYQKTAVLTFAIPELVELVQTQLAVQNPETAAWWREVQFYVFLALCAGFAIKVPLFPLHTWLPLAHVEAPTAGSVLLAGVLLKLGTYGFLRLCLPLTPDAVLSVGVPLIGTLAVIGIFYGSFCAYAQRDIKKMVAYSSVAHLGFCVLGLFALNAAGIAGGLMQMINHGLSTGGLFLLVGMLYERYHTRMMGDYGGLGARLKLLSLSMVFICLSSVGMPFLNGFIGEMLILAGVMDLRVSPGWAWAFSIAGAAGLVLGAWYLFTMLKNVFFGPLKEPHHDPNEGPVLDLDLRELATLIPVGLCCLAIGIYPQPMLRSTERDVGVVSRICDQARARAAAPAPAVAQSPTPPTDTR
ncbi:MAG: NuoM family protein [Gemmataceae bacterium]